MLVAAFATRGLCADVLRDVLAEHELLVGEVVLVELERVLTRRLRLPARSVEAIRQLLREHEVVPKPMRPSSLPVRDPADRWIVASALAGRADVLVTGDHDLLDIAAQTPLRILDPRAFWQLARRGH